MIGQVYDVQPMAPDPECTTYLDAGGLRIGIEYRELDPEKLADYYEGDDLKEVEEHSPEGGFTDEGVTIHVESVADDHEYLRFDVFLDDPHYHYVDKAAGTNTVVGFDRAAHGDMLPWVIGQLEHRLAPMLEAAGAAHVASELGPSAGADIAMLVSRQLAEIGFDPVGRGT